MQGFNRYFPADFDWRDSKRDSLNKVAGKHALGDRARKLDKGILITRFELPFNIWCLNCPGKGNHIGAGVRYNAEKIKRGMYYTTPIWGFRCKCHLCAGWFEIQTDPKNARYVVVEGAKQQAQDFDAEDGGHLVGYTGEGERAAAEGDAFASFEKASTSKKRALTDTERLNAMEDYNEEKWSDPYSLNRNLRKALREDKGKRKEKIAADASLAEKYSLGDQIRLDVVRSEEEQREDADSRAAWLSTAEKAETKQDREDADLWQLEVSKRRRIEPPRTETASVPRSAEQSDMPSSRQLIQRPPSTPKLVPSASSSAAAKLTQQLKLNAAAKRDPFATAFSGGFTSASGAFGNLVKAKRA